MTIGKSLETYCQQATTAGAINALVIDPARVVTAPWVRWKCRFACDRYGKSWLCPPNTPTPEETRQTLDSYSRAILTHYGWTKGQQSGRVIKNYFDSVIEIERQLFFDGFYRSLALLAGYCFTCKEGCAVLKNEQCRFPGKNRPSMESCGIDVYQTAHNYGLTIHTLRVESETRNFYCLLLVD